MKWIMGMAVLAAVAIALVKCKGGAGGVTFQTATVAQGTVETTVMATGYVQPVEEVEVGTQVSGVIEEIYVDYNSQVTKGQLLARLETNTLLERLNQAKATLRSGQSDLDYARQNHERVETLYNAKAATQVSYEEAVNRLNQAETVLENAKAALSQAEVNLSYAYIYSPIDGVVLDRAVNIGQTVAASFSTPTLFTIAEDLTKMQVEADVDEADIGQVRVGQQVSFTVDSYPDDTFSGTVNQVRLQPVVTSNVVTYTVIIDAPNPEEKLFPGMTASTTITVASEPGLVVPLEALNFMPGPELAGSVNMAGGPVEGDGVWVRTDGSITRQAVAIGLGDGVHAIARSGVSAGQEVVLSVSSGGEKADKREAASIMPRPPGGGPAGGGGPGGPR
jgi:HlyD family secretion protein